MLCSACRTGSRFPSPIGIHNCAYLLTCGVRVLCLQYAHFSRERQHLQQLLHRLLEETTVTASAMGAAATAAAAAAAADVKAEAASLALLEAQVAAEAGHQRSSRSASPSDASQPPPPLQRRQRQRQPPEEQQKKPPPPPQKKPPQQQKQRKPGVKQEDLEGQVQQERDPLCMQAFGRRMSEVSVRARPVAAAAAGWLWYRNAEVAARLDSDPWRPRVPTTALSVSSTHPFLCPSSGAVGAGAVPPPEQPG